MGAEELKELKELTSSLNKMMDELNDKSDKRNRALERQTQLTKRILGDIQSEEDINNGLIKLENQKKAILKSNFGINNKLKDDAITMLNASQNSLKVEKQKIAVLRRVATVTQGIADGFSDGADNLKGQLAEIPVLGGALSNLIPADSIRNSMDSLAGGFQQGFGTMFKRGMSQQKGFMKSFAGGMRGGMAGLSKQLAPLLANPYLLAAAAAAALIGVGIIAFKKMADATKAFREETGLLRSQTDGLDTTILKSYKSTVALGASMGEVAKVAAEFTNQFEGLVQPSKEVLTSVVALNKNMGIATQASIGANEVFQNMAGLSAEQAQYQVQQVALASQLAGVAPGKVMADIANSAEVAATYFQGSVGNLTKAAIQAAKMGTSLKQAAEVSDNLLDFESSITNELTASAMLGKSINFNKARELAAQGNIVGAQQSVLDTLEKTVDLNNVNKFQLDAIAKASGMPVAEIQKQLNLRKQFGKLDADQMKAAEELLASGKELSDISDEDLKKQTESVIANQQMQSEFDKMANQLSAIGSDILMTFMPVGKMIMGLLSPIMKLIKGFFAPIGNAIQGIMDAFKPIQDIMSDIFGDGAGIGAVFETIGTLLAGPLTFAINVFSNTLKMVLGAVSGIYDVFKGIFTGDFSLIGDGLMSIGESILRFFYAIPTLLYETIVDMFPSIGSFFSNLFGGVGDSIGGIFSSIFDRVKNVLAPVGDLFMKIGKILTLPYRILFAGLQAVGRVIMNNVIKPMIQFGKSLIGPIVEGFNMLSSFIMGTIIDPMVEFFGMLLNPLIEGFNYIGSLVQQYIVGPIMEAIDYLAGLNPFSWFSDDEEVPDPEVASADVTSTMGTAGEQSLEAEQLKVAGSIDDGIVQNGNIISTDPEDTLIATKTPSELIPQASAELIPQAPDITKPVAEKKSNLFGDGVMGKMIGMTPIGMAANAVNDAGGIEGAISGIGDFVGGLFGGDESESSSNKELLAKMDVLIQAVRQSGNISMDGKAVTDGIQQVVEKKTSNSFGLV